MGQLCMPTCGSLVAGGMLLEAWLCETGILLEAWVCETGIMLKVEPPSPAPSAGGQFRSKGRETKGCETNLAVRRLFGIRLPAPGEFIVLP